MKGKAFLAVIILLFIPLCNIEATEVFEKFPICTNEEYQLRASVDGNLVAWEDRRNSDEGYADIFGYDLESEEEFAICIEDSDQKDPVISGNVIVWEDCRNGDDDIYGKDLTSGQEFPICTGSENQSEPAISGNLVIWQDQRDGTVRVYDLSENVEFLTIDNGGGMFCDSSSPLLNNCKIIHNEAGVGGGIYCVADGCPVLNGTVVCGNDPNQIDGIFTDNGGNIIGQFPPPVPQLFGYQGDLDGNGITDLDDFVIFANNWLKGANP